MSDGRRPAKGYRRELHSQRDLLRRSRPQEPWHRCACVNDSATRPGDSRGRLVRVLRDDQERPGLQVTGFGRRKWNVSEASRGCLAREWDYDRRENGQMAMGGAILQDPLTRFTGV